MKIEKLTDNKIRVILKQEEFSNSDVDLETVFLKPIESQKLLLEILNKAKSEVDFNIEGCKLLVESFSSTDDTFIFTITKYNVTDTFKKEKKYLTVKRKSIESCNSTNVFEFKNFDNYCDFCSLINESSHIKLKSLYKYSALYMFNNLYYLVINGINNSNTSLSAFNSLILEFSTYITNSNFFEIKLKEHGKIVIKHNAITTVIKYFIHK